MAVANRARASDPALGHSAPWFNYNTSVAKVNQKLTKMQTWQHTIQSGRGKKEKQDI